jgi:hypothetical protein
MPLLLAAGMMACAPAETPVARVQMSPDSTDLGYSEVRSVELSWEILEPLGEGAVEPRVMVHLLDGPGNVLRTFDHDFPESWRPGDTVRYEVPVHQSALGPPIRAGRYQLSVGLYGADGVRWPLDMEDREIDTGEYEVGEITISQPDITPVFRFSDVWQPIEAGTDRQILGRRWLVGEGSIWVSKADSLHSVWMVVWIPTDESGVSRMMLEGEAEEPRVLLTSVCGGAEVEVNGVGRHEVEVPVGAEPPADSEEEPGECEIRLQPNFHLLMIPSGERRTVLLEAVAWTVNGRG